MAESFSSDRDDIPAFAGDDVVRLFTTTYLPLCRALHSAGAIDPASLARRIAAGAAADAGAPWTTLAHALAGVLCDDAAKTGA
ncbi:hypothetical protein [Caulobacter segnis]|uniref:hypothetical protein n=1 Tax=Caulobacter segnis TaxID=88688 RepID=UPI001CBF33B7|nr:hypothetical protein [Caulobacter segnis]UAL09174.1 hypothetical protein K8940_15405 [Caulobacter segnis]